MTGASALRRITRIFLPLGVGCAFAAGFFAFFSQPLWAGVSGSGPDALIRRTRTEFRRAAILQPLEPQASMTMSFGAIEVLTTTATVTVVGELARELAVAMDIPAADIRLAELMCDGTLGHCTDPTAVAVMGLAPGTWFPTRGAEFALLSTGRVTDALHTEDPHGAAEPADEHHAAAEILKGLKNEEDSDLVRLHLQLQSPPGAKCLALDFAFYTVDLPARGNVANVCQSRASDIFTAQINDPSLALVREPVTKTVTAPGNIAFNQEGDEVSAATMSPGAVYAALHSAPGSFIPGAFPLLQMRHVVTGGELLDLYFSIQDRSDDSGDSAVALDNFTWITGDETSACVSRPGNSGDRDGDGLPDGWEEYGVYGHGQDGLLRYLNLKTLGANPTVKDVFVEIDSTPPMTHDLQPLPEAMAAIVAAFANAPVDEIGPATAGAPKQYKGIHLHVDYGHTAPLSWGVRQNDHTPLWGAWSRGNVLDELPTVDLCAGRCDKSLLPLWQRIDDIKRDNFVPERARVFHYGLFAHSLATCTKRLLEDNVWLCNAVETISGISRNIDDTSHGASDFVVALGDRYWSEPGTNSTKWRTTRAEQQAGTFMHELGHNLGLNHYGTVAVREDERIMNKPNHLSVMNYLYQTKGLLASDPNFRFDYLRYDMAMLDEHLLTETNGLYWNASGVNITYTLGARYACGARTFTMTTDATQVDWNCNDWLTDTISINVTGDFTFSTPGAIVQNVPILSQLVANSEWDQLVFTGGLLNRQRSMLRPYIAERRSACPPQGLIPTFPGSFRPAAPITARRLLTPQPIVMAAADRQALEELTPSRDRQILHDGVLLREPPPDAPQPWSNDLLNFLNYLRERYPNSLSDPIDNFFDRLLDPMSGGPH